MATSAEIVSAIYKKLHQDDLISGFVGPLPYLSVHALSPDMQVNHKNWELKVGHCSDVVLAEAIQRAKTAVESEMWLSTHTTEIFRRGP